MAPVAYQVGYKKEAFRLARKIVDAGLREATLINLSNLSDLYGSDDLEKSRITQDCPDTTNLFQLLRQGSREMILDTISFSRHDLYTLGGREAMDEIFDAIQDVGRWWP